MSLPIRPSRADAAVGDLPQFTEAWLRNRRLSAHTRAAYRADVTAWLRWCDRAGLDPLTASFLHVNEYARELESTVDVRTGRPVAPATLARRLSGLSSWYDFLVRLRAAAANPVAGADRPRVSRDHSATIGLTAAEVDALLAAADREDGPLGPRHRAMLALLADLGLRVGELIALDVADFGHERGHRTVRFVGKGGKPRRRALAPGTAAALDAYLAARSGGPDGAIRSGPPDGAIRSGPPDGAIRSGGPDGAIRAGPPQGPLFVTATGARVDRHAVFRLVRRLARVAGIPTWAKLSPHSLRHAFATTARDEGVALEDVQDAMGHADPRTTRRYDRDRHNLDRDPSYAIWAARARRAP
jgi:site-specific recombinase XerD